MVINETADIKIHRAMKSIVEPLMVICAWCPTFDKTDPANAGGTHGMCASCHKSALTSGW